MDNDARTLSRTVKPHIEFLHVIVHQVDLIVGHEPVYGMSLSILALWPHAALRSTYNFMTSVSMRRFPGEVCIRESQGQIVSTISDN